jgi:hypothetical protein
VSFQRQSISVLSMPATSLAILPTIAYTLYILSPFVPLTILGYRTLKNRLMIIWMAICLTGIIAATTPVSVSNQLVSADRWVLMLAVPMVFGSIEGLAQLRFLRPGSFPSLGKAFAIGWVLLVLILGAAFVSLPASEALPYFSHFTPTSMLQSSVPLEDSGSLAASLSWLSAHAVLNSVLMTHHAIRGWALLFFHSGVPIVGYSAETSLSQALNLTINKGYTQIYTIWWTDHLGWYGEATVPTCFHEVHVEKSIAVFLCLVR